MKYKVITLCGSKKFEEYFNKTKEELILKGNIVLSVEFFKENELNENDMIMIGKMHKQKIDMSDEIYVINVDGYIGESTKSEIEYAKNKNKIIHYLEEYND